VTGTRDRILTATSELFRRHGYHGTSLKQVTTLAAAPTGSLYHFFPGGKDDLTLTVITTSGEAYRQLFELVADAAPDPAQAVSDFFEAAALMLEETDYIDPCPIGTVAREVASTNNTLREGTDQVFRGWIATAAERFERHGLPHDSADRLATTVVAAGRRLRPRPSQTRRRPPTRRRTQHAPPRRRGNHRGSCQIARTDRRALAG
jgi:AcrR family transcriptional regulator